MTPILRQLHWLPVRQRITFNTAVLVYKCRHGMAWLRHTCRHTASQRHHTAVGVTCALLSPVNCVPPTRTNYGDRSFAVHGSVVWNSLPADLRLLNISLPAFRKRLKNVPVLGLLLLCNG